ncbi:hypothetical protein GH714_024953 [Hevea brasiliensis]|uniref:STAS domain-containing protein n=1 Tax=Hevea brasiliensis TaxID=3981 RepID=A0A6A6KVN9_HEVBR|nr:hypothetical protein GH714_024953 [Hevea brasiliensis]
MGSKTRETYTVEELQQLDADDTGRRERAQWVLNSPDPPGLALASLSIPQSIGYATLAKLDPQYGLYTSFIPPLIYALMGSSREIAIGPVAVVSMLLSSMIQEIEDPATDPAAYRKMVLTVTFFAGIFQAVFGLFRLGFLVDFLSHAAIVGFMGGAAIVIGLQQLKGLLGINHFTNKTDLVSVLESVFTSIDHPWSPLNFVLGCSFLIFLLIARFIGRRNKKLFWFPVIAPLISVILSTLIVFLTKADKHGEAIAVGRSFASIKGYHLDGNKEMLAMGFMNIAGSLTSCYVATGSFSRTAVNFSAGLLYYTPIAILASIILSALPGVLDIHEAYYIWKVDKLDFLACVGAFVGVLFASVEIGLLAAVTISFAKILLNSIRPGIEELGRLPRTDTYCEINQYPMAIRTPGILVVRVNSALLCFANANFVRERILRWVTEEEDHVSNENTKEGIQAVILDMSNVTNVDIAGILALEELHKKLLSHETEANVYTIVDGSEIFGIFGCGPKILVGISYVRMQMPQLEKLKQLGNVQKILAAGTVQMNGLELFLLEPWVFDNSQY